MITALLALALAASPVVADWQMNEPPGSTVLQDSAGDHDGSIGSGVILTGTAHRYPRIPRGAYDPTRIDVVPDDDTLDPGTAPFTVRVEFRWPNHNHDNNLIQKGQGSPAGGIFKMKTSMLGDPKQAPGGIKCLFRGSGGNSQVESWHTGPRLDDGAWHTVTCGRDNTGTYMRVDGQLLDTNSNQPGSIANSWPIAIGGNTNCAGEGLECNYWQGQIGRVTWTVNP